MTIIKMKIFFIILRESKMDCCRAAEQIWLSHTIDYCLITNYMARSSTGLPSVSQSVCHLTITLASTSPVFYFNSPPDKSFPRVSVAYTADEVQYKWLSGSTPVGLEGDLQMSQFDLQQTFARELNFTRSESGWAGRKYMFT